MSTMTAQREIPLAEAIRRIMDSTNRSKAQAHIDMKRLDPTAVYGPTRMYGENDVADLIADLKRNEGAE